MKIAWVTPLVCGSAVSDASRLTGEALATKTTIEFFVPRCHQKNVQSSKLPTHFFNDPEDLRLRTTEFDLLVFIMGNFLSNHRDVFRALWKLKGVVILHDMVYRDFFEQYFSSQNILQQGQAFLEYWRDDPTMQLPLLSRAYGVVVHSDVHAAKIRKMYDGSILQTELPLLYKPSKVQKPSGATPLRVLILGTINRNKLITEIIRILQADKRLYGRIQLTIAGKVGDPAYFDELLALTRGQNWINLKRNITDKQKSILLEDSDVCINFRSPCIEGASETVLEELANGKTVLVLDSGSFKSLPDNCVIKLNPTQWEADLTNRLGELLNNVSILEEYHSAALRYMQNHHCVDTYALEIHSYFTEISKKLPWLRVLDKITAELARVSEPERSRMISQVLDIIPI